MKNGPKVSFVLCLLTAFVLIIGQDAYAQFPEEEPSSEKREQIRKRIETFRKVRLTEELGLDDSTSAKLFPVLGKYDKRRAKLQFEIRKGMMQLRRAVQNDSDTDFKGILEGLEKNHKEMQDINSDEFGELKAILTPRQQAQYLLFSLQFKHEIRKIIDEARGRGGRAMHDGRRSYGEGSDQGEMPYQDRPYRK